MVRFAIVGALVAGCYAPKAPVGVPCADTSDDSARCPAGQLCSGGVCEPPGFVGLDAARDATIAIDGTPGPDGPPDRDGDGVPDAVDNCPDIANADQGNEDGDRFGDVCDSCPADPDDTPTDSDGDGVGDDCDPFPNRAGDKIALFEGFHAGVPTGWTTMGTWHADGDDVVGTSTGFASLRLPFAPTLHEQVRIGLTPVLIRADTAMGVADPINAAASQGVFCGFGPGSGSGPIVGLINLVGDSVYAATAFTWAANSSYNIAMTRNVGYDVCAAADPHAQTDANPAVTLPTPEIGVGALDGTIRVHWVQVITQTGDESD